MIHPGGVEGESITETIGVEGDPTVRGDGDWRALIGVVGVGFVSTGAIHGTVKGLEIAMPDADLEPILNPPEERDNSAFPFVTGTELDVSIPFSEVLEFGDLMSGFDCTICCGFGACVGINFLPFNFSFGIIFRSPADSIDFGSVIDSFGDVSSPTPECIRGDDGAEKASIASPVDDSVLWSDGKEKISSVTVTPSRYSNDDDKFASSNGTLAF